ncbi:SDR family NAD(P)-dependent oxidoreductase [Nocardioides sp. YIM 152588]|uniref:SDR family NAD(P)-dependent oxidoreductase n=1 Tax=Nocardioides sp. YIM 152588 TaxID=3158259 RepID=UPI0032E3AB05
MPRALEDRVALVTGSTSGVGLAVARSLAGHGARVVINGRDPARLDAALADLAEAGADVSGVAGSAADPAVLEAMVEAAAGFGGPDVLVTCAGIAEPAGSSILDLDLADWQALVDSHLTATFVACRAVAPLMVERGRGAIVTTSSHAFTGVFGGTGYAAGKGGVNSLTYALAAELAEHGVRVNAVCPGARTRLSEGPDYEAGVRRLHERGLLDDLMLHGALHPPGPEHVAELYAFLASDVAAGISGEVLVGAGGYVGRFSRPEETMLTYRDDARHPPWSLGELAAALRPAATG